ncbi:MAG: ATP-binding cassette domain-containing protein [Chloroflexota bacterium]
MLTKKQRRRRMDRQVSATQPAATQPAAPAQAPVVESPPSPQVASQTASQNGAHPEPSAVVAPTPVPESGSNEVSEAAAETVVVAEPATESTDDSVSEVVETASDGIDEAIEPVVLADVDDSNVEDDETGVELAEIAAETEIDLYALLQPDISEDAQELRRQRAAMLSQKPVVIETVDLERTYSLGDQKVLALRGVNLRIHEGSLIALKGRSGSGKTTLLNSLGGLDSPTSGVVRILGDEIAGWSERKLTRWRREQVGFIFQSLGLLPTLSAYENVELIMRMVGENRKERHRRTLEVIDLVGLTKWMKHRPYELSGGQQQRVAVARALANRPKLILADEPTGELDSRTAQEILGLFQQIVHEQNVTMLMATHDSLVDEFVDQVIHLRDGKIVASLDEPEPEELAQEQNHAVNPELELVAEPT